jgi:hypothetical protein
MKRLNNFNNFPKFRWTIKLFLFGIGAGLLAKNQSMLGVMIANVLIFSLMFGVIGLITDLVKNATNKKTAERTKFHQQISNVLFLIKEFLFVLVRVRWLRIKL